jgi:TetR/AcrR family transcriptional regulator, cholesterol catabolism regulator
LSKRDLEQSILDAATELAADGGFENVRQRDVAERAGVALGTLYKRFRTKEELLAASLARTTEAFEARMAAAPAAGRTPAERVTAFFDAANDFLFERPDYARAVIRAVASGVPGVAGQVVAYQGRIAGLAIAALRDRGRLDFVDAQLHPPTTAELELATLLLQIWFAAQVGWSAGLYTIDQIRQQMARAVELLAPPLGFA